MNLDQLNSLSRIDAEAEFLRCLGSRKWAATMASKRPFSSFDSLCETGEKIWSAATKDERLEAFSHHPRIGGDIAKLREKFAPTKTWSSQEQAGVSQASEKTLQALSDGNLEYEKKFGFVFLICATGKSADEMLAALRSRLPNQMLQELDNASLEQTKIMRIRLAKLLEVHS